MIKTVELICANCNQPFLRSLNQHKSNIKRGRVTFTCSQECRTKIQTKEESVQTCQYPRCGISFSRKKKNRDSLKFCSRKCASQARVLEKNQLTLLCCDCGDVSVTGRAKYCDTCRANRHGTPRLKSEFADITLSGLREKYSTSQYHAKIRGWSRTEYKRSGKKLACVNCGYTLHVDICHIKDVKEFPESTAISVVNSIDNLIALDKRCHWEFDNGYLTLEQIYQNNANLVAEAGFEPLRRVN